MRGTTRRALVRAFGEFAPCADSGFRDAGWADADGGEPKPRESLSTGSKRLDGHILLARAHLAVSVKKSPSFDGLAGVFRPGRRHRAWYNRRMKNFPRIPAVIFVALTGAAGVLAKQCEPDKIARNILRDNSPKGKT